MAAYNYIGDTSITWYNGTSHLEDLHQKSCLSSATAGLMQVSMLLIGQLCYSWLNDYLLRNE